MTVGVSHLLFHWQITKGQLLRPKLTSHPYFQLYPKTEGKEKKPDCLGPETRGDNWIALRRLLQPLTQFLACHPGKVSTRNAVLCSG